MPLILRLNETVTLREKEQILARIREVGWEVRSFQAHDGKEFLLVFGEEVSFGSFPGVEEVVQTKSPYPLASRELRPHDTVVDVGGRLIGDRRLVVMAGPCAVESVEQLLAVAHFVKAQGATFLRGGAYKARTTPYRFRGYEEEGLRRLSLAREATGLAIVTEVLNQRDVELVYQYADVLQIGARNMQNFALLREVGRLDKPVLLKRGFAATLEEWLLAAEYILAEGNPHVVLCERGIRSFETYTRFTFDLNAIPAAKSLSHLPVIADPSHGTGRRELVLPVARAAVAAGADGLLVEVHPDPDHSLTSDGKQSLPLTQFAQLMEECRRVAFAVGRAL